MSGLFIPVILGTAREGRRSESVAAAVTDMLKRRDTMTQLIDVADYRLEATGGEDDLDRYRETMAAADGFVIVAPEYNHGYPGELKLLLDSEYSEYNRKPVGLVGVSSGRTGGARMIEQLQLVLTALRMVPVSPTLLVSEVEDAISPEGRIVPESLEEVADNMLEEVEWYAGVLKTARPKA